MKNELTETRDDGSPNGPAYVNSRASPTFLWAVTAYGLASFLFGAGLFGRELRFRAGAKRVTGLKVPDPVHGTAIQIREGRHVIEFPCHSEDNHALGPVKLLFNPEIKAAKYPYESHAALHGGPFFAGLGSLLALAGLVGLRNLHVVVPSARWIDLGLLLAGIAALSAVVSWAIASSETGWRWTFSTCMFAMFIAVLAIAGLAAVKHGFHRLLRLASSD